jgi:hypothetical protein
MSSNRGFADARLSEQAREQEAAAKAKFDKRNWRTATIQSVHAMREARRAAGEDLSGEDAGPEHAADDDAAVACGVCGAPTKDGKFAGEATDGVLKCPHCDGPVKFSAPPQIPPARGHERPSPLPGLTPRRTAAAQAMLAAKRGELSEDSSDADQFKQHQLAADIDDAVRAAMDAEQRELPEPKKLRDYGMTFRALANNDIAFQRLLEQYRRARGEPPVL